MRRFQIIIILSIGFLLASLHAQAQSMYGSVLNKADGSLIPYAYIANKTKGLYTTSDINGSYKIQIQTGDKILIQILGFKSDSLIITENVLPTTNISRDILLEIDNVNLKEVIITRELTQYQKDSVARRQVYAGVLGTTYTTTTFSKMRSPISSLFEGISPKAKMTKKFQANYGVWETENYISSIYTPALVGKYTKLTGDSLAHFMNAYQPTALFVREATEMELAMWIKYNYRNWMEVIEQENNYKNKQDQK